MVESSDANSDIVYDKPRKRSLRSQKKKSAIIVDGSDSDEQNDVIIIDHDAESQVKRNRRQKKNKKEASKKRKRHASPTGSPFKSVSTLFPLLTAKATDTHTSRFILTSSQPDPVQEDELDANATKRVNGSVIQPTMDDSYDDLWCKKYEPLFSEDLAVHVRKVKEVRTWLTTDGRNGRLGYPKILAMTGPAGAGKTATIQTLCNESRISVVEWTDSFNPNNLTANNDEVLFHTYDSVMKRFSDFFKTSVKSSQLLFAAPNPIQPGSATHLQESASNGHAQKVVLIEDFPLLNSMSSRSTFHQLLRWYALSSHRVYPLVLILSDIQRRQDDIIDDTATTFRKAIPEEILHSPVCSRISFNPVAPTILQKLLLRISQLQIRNIKSQKATKELVSSISKTCAGDIRSSLYRLQFHSLLATDSLSDNKETQNESRDDHVSLFHSLGRILHAKRNETHIPNQELQLDPSNHFYSRSLLEFDLSHTIDTLVQESDSSLMMLYSNLPHHVSEIDDLDKAMSYIGDSDIIAPVFWKTPALKSEYQTQLSTRGIVFSKGGSELFEPTDRSSNSLFQLTRSQWNSTLSKRHDRESAMQTIFSSLVFRPCHVFFNPTRTVSTQILPFLCMIDRNAPISFLHEYQRKFVHELSSYSRYASKNQLCFGKNQELEDILENEIPSRQIPPYLSNAGIPASLFSNGFFLPDDDIVDSDRDGTGS